MGDLGVIVSSDGKRATLLRMLAVFELAGTAVTLQRGTKVIRPDRHTEFP